MRTCEVVDCSLFVFGTDKLTRTGYCKNHQYLRTDISKEGIAQRALTKQRQTAAKNATSKLARIDAREDDNRELAKSYGELDRWFRERRKEMKGVCEHCGGKSCKDNDQYYKFSVAHLLPKNLFKSVATHPDNWIELCHFGKSCHANFDHHMIDLIELNCFDTVIQKFTRIYPHIAPEEKRRIPNILLEYLKVEQ